MTSHDLIRLAEDFWREPQVRTYFIPFNGGGRIDPLAKWAIEHVVHGEIRQLMILLDYLPKHYIGKWNDSVDNCVKYCQDHWTNEPRVKDPDKTFSFLMWSHWSRELLLAGRCLPVNALWGIRTKEPATKHLLFGQRNNLVADFRQTNPERIYVCHNELYGLLDGDNGTELYHPSYEYYWLMKGRP